MSAEHTKRIAYYIVALASFFFLSWAATDILSAGINLASLKSNMTSSLHAIDEDGHPEEVAPSGPGYNDIYRQMVFDRVMDSGARIIVAGIIFFLARRRIRELREV